MRRFPAPVVVHGCLVGCLVGLTLAVGCAPSPEGGPGTGGSNGSAGTNGTAGTTGDAGTNGTAGTSGDAGTNGTAGTSGDAGTTGSTGTAGTTGPAGTTGTGRGGAAGGRGGTTGMAGTTGGTAGTTGTGGSTSCTITPTASVSTRIPTVGIVTFTTSMTSPTSAKIDFGLTTSYGMTAPVDLTQANYRTLLLGMKAARMYNYRITVTNASGSCQGANQTIMTGALMAGLMKPTLTPATATGLYGGFLITGQYQGTPTTAYILDADGDFVWWYSIGSDVTGARMNYKGTHMWINSANVPGPNNQNVRYVTMDGMTEMNLSSSFTGMNHQLTVLPDETVAFYAYGSNGCDDVKERSPSGTVRTIVNSKTALRINDSMCHLNTIQYSQSDDSLVFSNLQSSQIAKVRRSDGSTVWIMNGSTATITGVTWTNGNHGIHMIDANRLILFNNNSAAGQNSIAMEIVISGTTATRPWMYNGGVANMIMGDVQRLPNGNTIVAYSTKGLLHEVNASMTRLQTWQWTQAGQTFGYIEKRASLYGPPPK